MALKNLTVEEMVQVSTPWVDTNDAAHVALSRQQRLSGLLPDLEQAHRAVLLVAPAPENPRKGEIARLAADEDALHDGLARGIHGLLTNIAMLGDAGGSALELRDQLMPEGLGAAIQATYRGQAGWTARLRARLTPELRAQLARIPLPEGKNLAQQVDAWLEAGERLGKLEEERARLEVSETKSFAAQVLAARNLWIRTVNALVGLAEMSILDDETDRVAFGPLRDAEAKADQRAARRSSSAVAPAGDLSTPA